MARGETKLRMVMSAISLLRERGAGAVTVDAVLADSGAPRGSVYHHFPGGRDELVLMAGRAAAGSITAFIDAAARESGPTELLDRFVEFWKAALAATEYRAGCPVMALAVDARDDLPEAAALVAETFTAWEDRVAAVLREAGHPREPAAGLATLVVAAVEGAVLLCRAHRSAQPLDEVVAHLRPLLKIG